MNEDLFVRGYYMVQNGHANTIPMLTLLESGGTKFYGLYRLMYEVTLLSEGKIKRRDLDFLCLAKGNLTDTETDDFIAICMEQGLLQPFNPPTEEESEFYWLPEVRDYLDYAEEVMRKKKEASSKGGQNSAKKRAENQTNDFQSLQSTSF